MAPQNSESPEVILHRVGALERGNEAILRRMETVENSIGTRLDLLSAKLDAAVLHMRTNSCPQPGLCVTLRESVNQLHESGKTDDAERTQLRRDIAELKTALEVGRAGLKVTIFWVGIMASALGAGASMLLPSLLRTG